MGTEDFPQMMNGGMMSLDNGMDLGCFMGGKNGKVAPGTGGGTGGGRRKQSKPIRLFADGETEPAGGAAALTLPENESSERGPNGGRAREEVSVGLEAEAGILLPCDLCPDTFRTEAQLSEHVQAVHNVGDERTRDASFLTKYHQLGSELNGSMMIEGASEPDEGYGDGGPINYESSTPPHIVQGLPTSREESQQRESPTRQERTPSREAFDRDSFLRKESPFTKPHNLMDIHNGHSRHENSPPSMVPSPHQDLRESDVMFPKKMESHPSPTTTANHILSMVSSAQNNSSNGMRGPLASLPKGGPGVQPLPTDKSKTGDMEDYCEICQKHFCNKYYLKKHKQDVHGIIPDQPATKRSRTTPASPLNNTSSTPTSLAASMNNMPNVMFLNPFLNPMLQGQPMLQAAAAQAAQSGGAFPPGLPGLPPLPHMPPTMPSPPSSNGEPQTPRKEQPLDLGQRPPSSSSPGATIPNDALRSMGVLNADAYCELCRKEFCNKYFLRIHKANKHGIYIDEPGLRGLPFGLPGMPPGFEGMPGLAQMMMPDGLLNPADLSKMFAGGELGALPTPPEGYRMPPLPTDGEVKVKPEIKTEVKSESTNEEFLCRQCSKEFASAYSLKVHMMNVHQVKPEIDRDFEREREKERERERERERDREREHREREREHHEREREREREREHRERERERESRPTFDELTKQPVLTPESLGLKMDSFQGLTPLPTDSLMNGGMGGGPGGTMFSNMITAKLADRVTCDICNKEVCNKYFLKTHKHKVHNIPPDGQSSSVKDERISPSQQRKPSSPKKSSPEKQLAALPSSLPGIPPIPDMPKPNSDELLKMGIDPEAYCEICKKEFCSKYFLKTHKLNIHGIKVNNTEARGMSGLSMLGNLPNGLTHGLGMPPTSMGLENLMPPSSLGQMSMGSHLPNSSSSSSPHLPVPNTGILSGPSPLPSALAFMAGNGGSHEQQMMEHDWRWKDQHGSSQQRIYCEVCNKEMANKYFLKMHMAQHHGVSWADNEHDRVKSRSANNSHTPSPNPDDGPTDLSKSSSRSKSEESSHDPENHPSGTVLAKTWHVPQEYHPDPASKKSGDNNHRSARESSSEAEHKCSVCSAAFTEVIKLQMHILQDHPGVVPTFSNGSPPLVSPSPKPRYHDEKKNTHEQQHHKHIDTHALTQALKRKYQQGLRRKQSMKRWKRLGNPSVGGGIGDRVKSAIMNHINKQQTDRHPSQLHQAGRRKFRCAHCQQRFPSRPICQAHIREHHPNARPRFRHHTNSNTTGNNNKPLYARLCMDDTDNEKDIVMQAFTLQETPMDIDRTTPTSTGDSVEDDSRRSGKQHSFANSIVCLPVYHRIPEPITVSFTLTPTPAAV